MIDRLQAHYGFTRMPFGRDLAPGMLHRHGSHAEAVARISWCVEQRVLGVVTGEVGAGKTVAVRAALAALDQVRHTIIYLGNPTIGARGIRHAIVTALGGVPHPHMAILVPQAANALATEHAERGRTPVLVIDEAHLLNHDQLEGIRMLTNHDLDRWSPFACLLIGQPTLRRRMKLGVLAALDQRIGLRYSMPGMTSDETATTSATTYAWPAVTTPCSPTTPPPRSTNPAAATPAPSTTSPSKHSSPHSPTAKPSSTNRPPAPRSAKSWPNRHTTMRPATSA
jgi:type II secretory pathway predicted ATPase ExeA